MTDQNAMAQFQAMFKDMQAHVKRTVIDGLRDPDPEEKNVSLLLLKDDFLPALQQHPNAVTRRMAISTINTLISECRPPNSEEEDYFLDEAIFHFCRRQLQLGASEKGIS